MEFDDELSSSNLLPRSRESRAERSKKLLQAAYELVPTVGIAGLRTRDITQRADVHLATFHYCFENKNALLTALYAQILDRFHRAIDSFVAQHSDIEARLEGHRRLREYLLKEDPNLLIVWKAFTGAMWSDPAIADIVRPHYRQMRAAFAKHAAMDPDDQAKRGLPKSNPALAAALVIAMYDGALTQLWLDPEQVSMEEFEEGLRILYSGNPDGV